MFVPGFIGPLMRNAAKQVPCDLHARRSVRCSTSAVHAEGAMFAPKDLSVKEHPNIPGVPNLYVVKAMQSFESKELVTARYAWRNHYWFLTDAGITYLREYLNIPESVAPQTLIRATNRCAAALLASRLPAAPLPGLAVRA